MPTTPHRTKTLRSITGMIDHVSDLRERIETDVVMGKLAPALESVFSRAERALAQQQALFRGLKTNAAGHIVRSVQNIDEGLRIVDDLGVQINKWVVKPGKQWADKMLPIAEQAGYDLAAANLEVRFLSQTQIDAVFDHIPRSVGVGLRTGKLRTYEHVNVIGQDVQNWFRNEILDAINEGIPLQGRGDSLANRLVRSGRILPVETTAKSGRVIRRSLTTRANEIARLEPAKIMGSVHEAWAQDALGNEAVYVNSNPRDSRTTPICRDASRQKPHPLAWWDASRFGRAPRFKPFHWCRSALIGGLPEWFDDE